jgi:hypothetical protein
MYISRVARTVSGVGEVVELRSFPMESSLLPLLLYEHELLAIDLRLDIMTDY